MIPVTLQITNFLSYGSTAQTIDFSAYKLICLSGKNGHGKSALLDAITWVIWGQARKIGAQSKPDEGLMRLGANSMCVAFDFIFNNQHYRIKREFSKKYGKATNYLDFGMLETTNNKYIPLTDKTVRATQEKIEQILGLDYETFANSSFLRQGQSNEFSKKSPKERKEIVTAILGLAHFDKAKKYVLDRIRNNTTEKFHFEKMALHLQQEIETFALLETQEETCNTLDIEIKNKSETLHHKTDFFMKQQEAYTEKKQTLDMLTKKINELNAQYAEQKEILTTTTSSWKQTHRYLLTLPDKKKLEQEKIDIINRIAQRQQKQQLYLTKKEELILLKEQLTIKQKLATVDHENKVSVLKNTVQKTQTELLNIQKQTQEYDKEYAQISHKKNDITALIVQLRMNIPAHYLIKDLEELQTTFEKHKMLYQKWIEQGNWVHANLKELAAKKQLNNQTEVPCCPLCEQSLSQTRKRFLLNKFDEETVLYTHRFNRLKKYIELLKTNISQEHKQLQNMTALCTHTKDIFEKEQAQELLQKKVQELTDQKDVLTLSLKEVEKTIEQEISAHTLALHNDPTIQALVAHIKALEEYLINTQSYSDEHAKDSATLAFIESGLQQHATLESTINQQQERKATVHNICCTLKKTVAQLQELQRDQPALIATACEQEAYLYQEKATIELLQKEIAQAKNEVATLKGTIEAQKQKKKTLEINSKKNNQALHECIATLHDDTIIATALGKDGIQALLIEDALPEIEEEANSLLARLTDNQTHISIESLRDLKKGGTKETLDINISDAQGVRPYEMFSGGEAFRIDFALRIALSKLLARRAGTSLQTLIIDEGFGSQDEDGLARIMDALYAIQNDFEKIIIVSHLTSMKDQFPVHFVAHKDQNGSKITVVQQG